VVVAPSMIPRKSGDRQKNDKRDAASLAVLHRGWLLTAVWVPDVAHEAMRDLIRARLAAVRMVRTARQQLSAFLLRHDRTYPNGRRPWTKAHRVWLADQTFASAGLAATIGDPSRFASASDFMGYLGLLPSEHSSGAARQSR
jgi:transposase